MKLFHENEKIDGLCEDDGRVRATLRYRDHELEGGLGVVRNVLVSVCDLCDQTIGIPHQSTPAIRDARQRAVASVELNLPAIYVDMIDAAVFRVDPESNAEMRKRVLVYYLARYVREEDRMHELNAILAKDVGARPGMPTRRLSFKFSASAVKLLEAAMARTGLNRTDLTKALIAKIGEDLIEPASPPLLPELSLLAQVLKA